MELNAVGQELWAQMNLLLYNLPSLWSSVTDSETKESHSETQPVAWFICQYVPAFPMLWEVTFLSAPCCSMTSS